MLLAIGLKVVLNVGEAEGVFSVAGEEKVAEFVPLTLALRG